MSIRSSNRSSHRTSKRRGCKPIIEPKVYTKLVFENMTVVRGSLLKIYYWEHCEIDDLNAKLASDNEVIQHTMKIPSRLINSESLKFVFWLRNNSSTKLDMHLKRVKNCRCIVKSTRVGFNQFRELFQCPHRQLLTISQEIIQIKPNELAAMTVTTRYHIIGPQYLTYDIRCSDDRYIRLNFLMDVGYIQPAKFVLTKSLMPVDNKEYRRYIQPIWVHNLSYMHLPFNFSAQKRGLKIINQKIILPSNSVFPLMVQYRPADAKNELNFKAHYKKQVEDFKIAADAINPDNLPDPVVPVLDYPSNDQLCIVYPNKIEYDVEINEQRSLLIVIHNFEKKCVEFHCKQYIIEQCFEIYFEPENFRLKPQHSKLVLVTVRVYNKPSYFTRIPVVIEVHRVLDHSTRIAQQILGSDIESIDDPKWKQQSYMHHMNLHVNLIIRLPKIDIHEIEFKPEDMLSKKPLSYGTPVTVIEQLFGQKLAETNFMRPHKKPIWPSSFTYHEFLIYSKNPELMPKAKPTHRMFILKLEIELFYECLEDLGKNWKFIPKSYAEQLV